MAYIKALREASVPAIFAGCSKEDAQARMCMASPRQIAEAVVRCWE